MHEKPYPAVGASKFRLQCDMTEILYWTKSSWQNSVTYNCRGRQTIYINLHVFCDFAWLFNAISPIMLLCSLLSPHSDWYQLICYMLLSSSPFPTIKLIHTSPSWSAYGSITAPSPYHGACQSVVWVLLQSKAGLLRFWLALPNNARQQIMHA